MQTIVEKINQILQRNYNTDSKVDVLGEVFTPTWYVRLMIDEIPEAILEDPISTYFDPCAGIGNFFAVLLEEKLMHSLKDWEPNDKLRYKHIVENQLFFNEINQESCEFIETLFNPNGEYKLNLQKHDAQQLPFMSRDDWKNKNFKHISHKFFKY